MAPPRQLRLAMRQFIGRERECRLLEKWSAELAVGAASRQASRPAVGTPVVVALTGMAGVGKTSLAVHWAHRVADRFPDGQLFADLRGFDGPGRPVDPQQVLDGFLQALGVDARDLPANGDDRAALYRTALADKQLLVVLDDARDAEQVRPLLPGSPGCLVLITSRDRLTALVATEGAHSLGLDLPSAEDARTFLLSRLGSRRLESEPQAVEAILHRCARLPLALSIVAARACLQPNRPLAHVAADLRSAAGLDCLAAGDPRADLRTVFSWSYAALSAPAARLFRLLGLHPGSDITPAAAASLAGISTRECLTQLTDLESAHLLTQQRSGRYSMHDLLRAYAAEQAHAHDTDDDRRTAVHRWLDHYLHTADAATRRLEVYRDPIALQPPHPGVVADGFDDDDQALAWLTVEHPVLLAAISHAADAGFPTQAWQLACTLTEVFERTGCWSDWATSHTAALAAAEQAADPSAMAHSHCGLGRAFMWLGRWDEARGHHHRALELFTELRDDVGRARTLHSLGYLTELQGLPTVQALHYSTRALELLRATDDRIGLAKALNAVGWYHALLGDHERALRYCQDGADLARQLGDRTIEAHSLDSLGYANHHLGDHQQAISCYTRALHLLRTLGDRYHDAEVSCHLGDVHAANHNHVAARAAWRHAVTVFDQLGHPDADAVRARLDDAPGARRSDRSA